MVKARRLFRIAAKAGDADAAMNLGLIYLNGEGIAVNSLVARYWLEMSAAHGNGDALNVLGAIKFNGQCGDAESSPGLAFSQRPPKWAQSSG